MNFMMSIFGIIVLIGGVCAIGLILAVILCFFRATRVPYSEADRAEETKMMQELYQDLETMEKRIESLETLVLDSQHRPAEAEDGSRRKESLDA